MNFTSQTREHFPRKWTVSRQQGSFRPALECLEDRQLLSTGFLQVNLASDIPGLARVVDPALANPWGMAFSPTGPFWLAENGHGVSDILDGRGQLVPLVVSVPSAGHSASEPTGTVFNSSSGFVISANGVSAPSRFLFVTEDGTLSGWSSVVDSDRAVLVVDNSSSGAVYTGLAIAADSAGHSFLYAADFSHGAIDVFDGDFRPVVRPAAFVDPNLPAGFAPFNIQVINHHLFVTYAQRDEDGREAVAGAGHGFIDIFNADGSFVERFASQGELDAPWGLTLAPSGFGPFGGALLIGNNGDGRILAYDPRSGAYLGQLENDDGVPITIPNLWALTFGNGHAGGDSSTLFFAAGVGYDTHGLFGAVQAPDRQGWDTAGAGVFDPDAPGEPNDYPLPPSGGPALRASGEDQPVPVADLFPLRDSSLILAPTLTSVPSASRRMEAPMPTTPAAEFVSRGSTPTTSSTPGSIVLLGFEADSQPSMDARSEALALSAFLDLNPAQTSPADPASVQPANAHQDGVGNRRSAIAAGDIPNETRVAEPRTDDLDIASSAEQAPPSPAPSGPAATAVARGPSECLPGSADDLTEENHSDETQGCSSLMVSVGIALVAVGLPTIWAVSRQFGAGRAADSGKNAVTAYHSSVADCASRRWAELSPS